MSTLTTPARGGDCVEAVKQLQGLKVSLVAGASANEVTAVSGMKESAVILSALNNNAGTITDVTDTISIDAGRASGTLTLDTVVENETATVHDVVFTFKDSPSSAHTEVQVGATDAESADNLAEAINSYFDPLAKAGRALIAPYLRVTAEAASDVVTVTAWEPGAAGNAIALAGSAQITASAATLEDGADDAGVASTGDTDQLILFWYDV
jgi:hypothetical protein